jgi:hypothetical protein
MSNDQDQDQVERLPERRLDEAAGARRAEDLKARFQVVSTSAGLGRERRHTLARLAPLIAFFVTVIVVGYFLFFAR